MHHEIDLGANPADSPVVEVFASPGVPTSRKIATGIFLAILGGFTLFVAAEQRASVLISTVIGAAFILGFIGYLRIIAPQPFRLSLDADRLVYQEGGADGMVIAWPNVVKVKEERFPNGLPISVTVYKRVGERGLHRAFLIWRDDLPEFEPFLKALRAHVPAETRWNVETVHE